MTVGIDISVAQVAATLVLVAVAVAVSFWQRAGLEEDIAFCAQVSVLDIVPRLSRMVDGAAEITAR